MSYITNLAAKKSYPAYEQAKNAWELVRNHPGKSMLAAAVAIATLWATKNGYMPTPSRIYSIFFPLKQQPLNPPPQQPLNPPQQPFSSINDWAGSILSCLNAENLEQINCMIDFGIKKNWLNTIFNNVIGGTIFHRFAKYEIASPYIRKLIENGGDPAIQDIIYGNTPLLWSIANAANGTAMEILNNTPESAPYLDLLSNEPMKNTALHLAVGKGYDQVSRDNQQLKFTNLELVNKLLEKKANPNLTDSNGNTPLHLAYLHRNRDMIKALKGAGADQAIRNNKGQIPLDLATTSFEEAITILLKSVSVFLLDKNRFNTPYIDS